VTARVCARSAKERAAYLEQLRAAPSRQPHRQRHVCSNLAHAFAAAPEADKLIMLSVQLVPDIGIASAYNDMLSAHQPLGDYPVLLNDEIRKAGVVAQFAGGVPAMCDGVTQGTPGMELSLLSRDVIAQATAIALAHNMCDGALLLGVCDKIVPGLVIGALHFGHLPCILIPAGPMPSGLSNSEKAEIRQLYAQGKVGHDALLACEARAYHSAGTCTFYGTANSN
jgi:phosphogluconate dehydratase